jgi:hypothetical protein
MVRADGRRGVGCADGVVGAIREGREAMTAFAGAFVGALLIACLIVLVAGEIVYWQTRKWLSTHRRMP